MNLAGALLILFSHAGFWVGGQQQTIELRWTVAAPMPAAVVRWELRAGDATLVSGQSDLPAGENGRATIALAVPKVREAVKAAFRYNVVAVEGGRELAAGERAVNLYPDRLAELRALTEGKPLLVVDAADRLPSVLKAGGAAFDRIDSPVGLMGATQKVIVIGQERLMADDPAAATVTALAQGGASVVLLRQSAGSNVLGYPLVIRDVAGYTVDATHPLLRHLPGSAWATLLAGPARQPTLSLPVGEPALELVHSPIEANGVRSAPLDALLVTRTMGAGRIVFCQLSIDHPTADARQQQLLLNLIEYAQTRPQPTPARGVPLIEKKPDGGRAKSPKQIGGVP